MPCRNPPRHVASTEKHRRTASRSTFHMPKPKGNAYSCLSAGRRLRNNHHHHHHYTVPSIAKAPNKRIASAASINPINYHPPSPRLHPHPDPLRRKPAVSAWAGPAAPSTRASRSLMTVMRADWAHSLPVFLLQVLERAAAARTSHREAANGGLDGLDGFGQPCGSFASRRPSPHAV